MRGSWDALPRLSTNNEEVLLVGLCHEPVQDGTRLGVARVLGINELGLHLLVDHQKYQFDVFALLQTFECCLDLSDFILLYYLLLGIADTISHNENLFRSNAAV